MAKKIETIIPIIPKTPKLLRVAAYARVSCGKDMMMHSLAAQVAYFSALIQRNPQWVYAGVYADEPTTGTKNNRPQLRSLLDDCRAGKIDIIIVKSISRFARNTVDLLNIVREMKGLGIDIFFEEQNIHSLSSDGELLLTILASYAQEESRSVSENCKWAYQKAFRNGEVPNVFKLYGYCEIDGEIVINEKEAEVVRRIFQSYLDGLTTMQIAEMLNEEGVLTKLGKRWRDPHIREMLRNEKYVGNALLQKTFIRDHISKQYVRNYGEKTRYFAENTHPAIVSNEVFDAVQQKMDSICKMFNSHRQEHLKHYPFTGKIKCKNCGQSFRRVTTKYEVSWNCSTYVNRGKSACMSKKIPEDILMQKAADVLGIPEFSAAEFAKQIREIQIPEPNMLIFIRSDGTKAQRQWKDKSRADSWTPEMRTAAAENTRKRYKK